MSYPIFTAAGLAPLTLSRGDAWPRQPEVDDGQLVATSEAGLVRVATLHAPITRLRLAYTGGAALPSADYLALKAFLEDPAVNLKATVITYTDVDGTAYQVRYWDGLYAFAHITPGLWQGTLTLRVEV
jgi:hypothetical protein